MPNRSFCRRAFLLLLIASSAACGEDKPVRLPSACIAPDSGAVTPHGGHADAACATQGGSAGSGTGGATGGTDGSAGGAAGSAGGAGGTMGATTPCLPAMDAQVPTTPGDAVDPTDAGADAALSGDAAEAELGDAGDVQLSDAAAAMADSAASVDTSTPPASACAIEREDPRSEGAGHTNKLCEPVSYKSHPPSSGTHYGTWPVFRAYSEPVPWGFLVHGLEHGAVVIAYNCPQGCAAEVAAAKALMASVPNKEGCSRPPVILTPDPTLRTRFAAAAWGHVLRASCFDRPAFAAFISAYANKGPEYFPSDCGAVDYEGMGWCPTCK